ncbi:MAG: uracil-DNA glycosylase family protein [Saprospiraceae bacterium]|nr:uracil-DNA glycosylase family protein [Saprospiraceae bacterium]
MKELLTDIRNCVTCLPHLSHGVNPVLSIHAESKIAIIGQAPGSIVHLSGIPWDDKSGDRLREWLGVDAPDFYDSMNFAIVPMGFCYPGKGKSGDLPPRPECAPQWHEAIFDRLNQIELVLLIGAYAQKYYLGDRMERNLTETVRNFREYMPQFIPLPHPSPRNNIWLRKNLWFDKELIPELQKVVKEIL